MLARVHIQVHPTGLGWIYQVWAGILRPGTPQACTLRVAFLAR